MTDAVPRWTSPGTVLLSFDISQRRRLVEPGQPWAPLADSLSADLEVLLTHEAPVPRRKARLTKVGGRCARDGVLLDFDPLSPHVHRCPQCGKEYSRDEDYDWWVMDAHLWSVERAVHAAALFLLRKNEHHYRIASDILARIADVYLELPNVDNVLGPTRPFFSTYLESIWLLNICHAASLLAVASPDARTHALLQRVADRVVEPSAALIAEFNEGLSNRQVWNEVALLAAQRVLGNMDAFHARVESHTGFARFIKSGILDDGIWYEGENYHQFAQRGLWYGVELLAASGASLPQSLVDRYARGFVAPFEGILPDDTFPSRRDSQYRVSIRQWRFAEWCELGLSVRSDERLAGIRSRLYDQSVPRRDTGRARSTADAERNAPASALTRADCSWRALLMADPSYETANWTPESALLESQGLAVLRQQGGCVYVALEGGRHNGGGHGHPDRLALTVQVDNERMLEDVGTGSYVERTLHWYRSTLAHAAPLVDGKSQQPTATQLLAWEDRAAAGWVSKSGTIADGVSLTRTVVVCQTYLLDILEWSWEHEHELTLMVCGNATANEPLLWTPHNVRGAGGLEDGFEFLSHVELAPITGQTTLHALPQSATGATARTLVLAARTDGRVDLMRAVAPGAPGYEPQSRHWIRSRSRKGTLVSCWQLSAHGSDSVANVQLTPASTPVARVETNDGTVALHQRAAHGWHIELLAGGARSSIDLEGLRAQPNVIPRKGAKRTEVREVVELRESKTVRFELGAEHYLRTEQSWLDAGQPAATIDLSLAGSVLTIVVHARTGSPSVPEAGIENMLDNEHADVNADGVQLYFGTATGDAWSDAWLIVPAVPVRVTPLIPGTASTLDAKWEATESGWRMSISVDLSRYRAAGTCAFDIIVNERPASRERRRGQLVLSGARATSGAGEFAYLRGDRHDYARAVLLHFAE